MISTNRNERELQSAVSSASEENLLKVEDKKNSYVVDFDDALQYPDMLD